MAHIFDIGTRAWQPDTTEGWIASEVTDKQIAGDKVTLVFKLENGEVCTTTTTTRTRNEWAAEDGLTMGYTDQDRRDDPVRHPDGQ
jgi:myosin heavy subunit